MTDGSYCQIADILWKKVLARFGSSSGYQTRAFNAVCTAVECVSTAVIKKRAFNAVCTAVECVTTAVIKKEHSTPCVRQWSVCLQRLSNKSIQCSVYGGGVYVYSGYQTRAFNAVCTAV